jgi:hypothetical protein
MAKFIPFLESEDKPLKIKKRKKTPGVVYLSSIPTKMNVKLIRDYFGDFGAVDRIFLQPEGKLLSTILEGCSYFLLKLNQKRKKRVELECLQKVGLNLKIKRLQSQFLKN